MNQENKGVKSNMNNTQKEEEKCNKCEKGEKHGHCTDCNALIEKCKCPERQSDGSWIPPTDSNWAKQITLENFFELFEFDGVTYKGQRHSEKKVKNHLVKKGIDSILQQERQREREKIEKEKWVAPCSGCPDGHSSFWKTIVESYEWKAWYSYQMENQTFDIDESQECGWLGVKHRDAFFEFVRQKERDKMIEIIKEKQTTIRLEQFTVDTILDIIKNKE